LERAKIRSAATAGYAGWPRRSATRHPFNRRGASDSLPFRWRCCPAVRRLADLPALSGRN
ncbi:MAG TPA: hypothetical protein V6D08_15205, partial [Candidatus Obscuribacterales bacterium]